MKEYYDFEELDKSKEKNSLGCLFWIPGGIFLLAIIVMFVMGLSSTISLKVKEKKCTELVTAKVRVVEDQFDDSKGYTPVFIYRYEEVLHNVRGSAISSDLHYTDGEEVDVYVDPKDPEKIYVPSYTEGKDTSVGITIMSGIMLIAAILIIWLCNRKVRKTKKDKYENHDDGEYL